MAINRTNLFSRLSLASYMYSSRETLFDDLVVKRVW